MGHAPDGSLWPFLWTPNVIGVLLRRISSAWRGHRGCSPPLVEICHHAPPDGKAVTYISSRPDSSDEYVTHRQSGENTLRSSTSRPRAERVVRQCFYNRRPVQRLCTLTGFSDEPHRRVSNGHFRCGPRRSAPSWNSRDPAQSKCFLSLCPRSAPCRHDCPPRIALGWPRVAALNAGLTGARMRSSEVPIE
jgi:hypothetical protein